MDNKSVFKSGIEKIYKKVSYFDKYGGSFIITFITLISFTLVFTYFWVNSQIKPIKADWGKMKCHPGVIPFAGMINAPPGVSKFKFTTENLNSCLYGILSSIIGRFTKPAFFMSERITNLFKMITDMINAIRGIIDYLRTKIMALMMQILERFINVITPIHLVVIKLKSLLGKVVGIMTTGLFTAIGTFYALKSFIGAFLKLIILALIVLAAVVIILWIFPWTWALAYIGTLAYIAIAIPTIIVAVWMSYILQMQQTESTPGCCCFDENTPIKLIDKIIKIKDIKLVDVLKDGSKVTSKLEIANKNKKMYEVDGIIVSGSHFIYDKIEGWVNVSKYKNAIEMDNYSSDVIYCINTSSKTIEIGKHLFLDWDDITELDFIKLKNKKILENEDKIENIHNKLDGGFIQETKIELEDGNLINIKDVSINDILKYGEVVIAKVEIDGKNLKEIKEYNYDNFKFSGINLMIKENLGIKHTRKINGNIIKNRDKLYHLVTDKGYFYVNGLIFLDYNGCLEQVLDIYENKKKTF